MRYCKRFYCDEVGDRVCCPTCWLRRDCAHPCLNHPARCGLEDKEYKNRNAEAAGASSGRRNNSK